MKSPFFKFLVFGLFISFFACGDSPLDAVEDLFEEYKAAIEQKQYGKAAGLIDQKSVEYYNQVIKLALERERKQLGEVNFNSKLMALALRQNYSKKELKDFIKNQTPIIKKGFDLELSKRDLVDLVKFKQPVQRKGYNILIAIQYTEDGCPPAAG